MPETNKASIVVSADTSGFEEAMEDIKDTTEQFGHVFAATMRQAVLSGRDLDDTLRSIALRFADLALGKALAPLENAVADLVGSAMGAAFPPASRHSTTTTSSNITLNVTTPDAAGFGRSQSQLTTMLARAVAQG
ncbi:MAG: hypothetical protein VYD64_04370, partial [Pseudomonadota bacterium]|nr:hypothetical protein [Pseudomonadota bacterium]